MAQKPKLKWFKRGTLLIGGLGKSSDLEGLFILREADGEWRLTTTLPAHFRAGAFGSPVDSTEAGKELAEEILRDFYRIMKRVMESRA